MLLDSVTDIERRLLIILRKYTVISKEENLRNL